MSEHENNATGSDFSYLFFRNGVNFRINYLDDEINIHRRSSTVKNLTDLCSSKIVRNQFLTQFACDIIPKDLFYRLFRAALQNTHDDTCINMLITRWPDRVLRLENYVDEKLTSLKMLLCEKTALQRTRQAIKYAVIIIPRFIDSIRQAQYLTENRLSNLRILDVTNFPVVELIIRYISTHCRLAEKESKRNELIDIYNEQNQNPQPQETQTTADDLTKSNTYPIDKIIIRFDCIIQDYRTYVELLSALRSPTANIQLQICTIDMRCIGLALVSSFLDHVDKRVKQIKSLKREREKTNFIFFEFFSLFILYVFLIMF